MPKELTGKEKDEVVLVLLRELREHQHWPYLVEHIKMNQPVVMPYSAEHDCEAYKRESYQLEGYRKLMYILGVDNARR